METVKLNASQIELFISNARVHVANYQSRDDLTFIGGPREAQLLQCLTEDAVEHSDQLSIKVDNSTLKHAINYAFRIYRASDPYSSEEDRVIYGEARELVTYVLGQTNCLESLAADCPGQYVWLVIATLMAVSEVDNAVAMQAASGYETLVGAKAEGIGVATGDQHNTSVHTTSKNLSRNTTHEQALRLIRKLTKPDSSIPEVLTGSYEAFRSDFPYYRQEAIKLGVIAALATAQLDKGDHSSTFEFKYTTNG